MLRLNRREALVGAGLLGAGALLSEPAAAKSPPHIIRYAVPVRGSSVRAGAARAGVEVDARLLKSVVTDYSRYQKFIKHFETARVVKRSAGATDMYLEVPILHGLSKVWSVTRFEEDAREDGSSVVRGKMLKGNMKRFDTTWRVRKLPDGRGELVLELFVVPDFPAPDSLVLKEAQRAAASGLKGALEEAVRRSRG